MRLAEVAPDKFLTVIGDTSNDIDCGRVSRARTVAVATGPFGAGDLLAHGADVVLPSRPPPTR